MKGLELNFSGSRFFLTGIKGTGMSTLAVILKRAGAEVTGCDSPEVFPTDQVLIDEKVPFLSGFGAENLDMKADYAVYSDAFSPSSCPVLAAAKAVPAIKLFSYPQFLAFLSENCRTYAVAGTHGKTTTTAAAAYLLSQDSRKSFPFFAVFGSELNGRGPVFQGTDEMLIEACEYRDHFLSYKVRGALVTSIEMDHPDWFADEEAVFQSFSKFAMGIEKGGFLILCVDSPRVKSLCSWISRNRRDLVIVEYGFTAHGPFRIRHGYSIDLLQYRSFNFEAQAREIIADYFGAAILASSILLDRPDPKLYFDGTELISDEILGTLIGSMMKQMESFPGVHSRGEEVASEGGVVYIDDYAHHPTEIRVCLENLRLRYPAMAIVVAFCPHTYSRTAALMDGFISSLSLADIVVVQKTCQSARGETAEHDNARDLASRLENQALRRAHGHLESAVYIEYDEDAASYLARALDSGGVCVSLGAGNNRHLLEMIRIKRRREAE